MDLVVASSSSKHQQLLSDLKSTAESLLCGQVANVWFVYGGLNRLHNAVERIFKHGSIAVCTEGISAYWTFIQALDWLQPDTIKSNFSTDCQHKQHIPQRLHGDSAAIWLYTSLEEHSLSQKLAWLLSDKGHLCASYQQQAFLRQERYAEALLICLRAVERNQASLLSEIEPCLFLGKKSPKVHRRCSSFPDRHYSTVKRQDDSKIPDFQIVYCKIKPWSSMPNLQSRSMSSLFKKKSRTMPSTPSLSSCNNDIELTLTPKKMPKRIVINNFDIIEHTPPSCRKDEEFANLSTKSLPEDRKLLSKKGSGMAKSMPDYRFTSTLAGEKDYKRLPKKSFIEDGGMSVLPMATGYFPRPSKGQTLASFLTSSQFARANAELDRENAHFSISEAMIAAIEQMRCRHDLKVADEHAEESDEEIMDLKQRIRLKRREKLEQGQRKALGPSILSDGTTTESVSPFSSSPCLTSNSITSEDDIDIDEACTLQDSRGASISMASLYSDADIFHKSRGVPDGASDVLSAEGVALSLISRFNQKQLPRASDLEWLVSEEDAPQALLPLPKSWPISPDDCESSSITPLRGTREWAPPRAQIIFTPHPPPRRKNLVERQNYRCAGCGMRVAIRYASRMRYCEYLGKYFCTGCHTNQVAVIPGKVLQKWDFTSYAVSNFSYRLLEQMYNDPLFRIFDLNKNIGKRSKNILLCHRYRIGLFYLKDFVMSCRYSETIQEILGRERPYIVGDPDIYSLHDLIEVRNGNMKARLRYLVEICCRHTAECQLCLARGFICELCKADEVIFPWQLRNVTRCPSCGSCFHSRCWNKSEKPCSKCLRITRRKESTTSEPSISMTM